MVAGSSRVIVACALLVFAPALTRSADDTVSTAAHSGPSSPSPSSGLLLAQADEQAQPGSESDASPSQPPSPPAETPPSPPFADEAQSAQASVPPGQWVYTQHYGWVWMPYGEDYTYVPPDGYGEPYVYVYYPDIGWNWVVAPWVWGFGPWPLGFTDPSTSRGTGVGGDLPGVGTSRLLHTSLSMECGLGRSAAASSFGALPPVIPSSAGQ